MTALGAIVRVALAGRGSMAGGAFRDPPRPVLRLGTSGWAAPHALLSPSGIDKPIGDYDRETVVRDASAHVFGPNTGAGFAALRGAHGLAAVLRWSA